MELEGRWISQRSIALIAAGCILAVGAATLPAPAALDLAVGGRRVVKNQPVSTCNAAAKTALNAVLQDASEIGTGDTGEWRAYAPADSTGHPSAAAAVHCYPLDDGFVVTFTCAVEVPPSTDTASALCSKLATAFGPGGGT
jgi:hypothetical protein